MSNIDDQELVRRLRADLDQLVGDAGRSAPPQLPALAAQSTPPHGSSSRRWIALSAAAGTIAVLVGGLVVIANRDADDDVEATIPPSVTTVPDATLPGTTLPGTTVPGVPPITEPATTLTPVDRAQYEVLGTVIDDGGGTKLCFSVMESLPPQCGSGMSLLDWSWDLIDVEQTGGDSSAPVTWVDGIYLRVALEPSTHELHTLEARIPTDAERERLTGGPELDFSVPCPEPEGGWPARNQEWPPEIAGIDGYAGSWVDESQQVMTVKFTGDLDAASNAVSQYYSDAVCYVSATHTEAELQAIQSQLMSMSSVQFSSIAIYVDATGEWVQADIAGPPDPERQASFDAEYGDGVVRLSSPLHPVGQLNEYAGTVLAEPGKPIVLCVGTVLESHPVQCPGSPKLLGWSWDLVVGEETVGDTTFALAYVTGYYDTAANTFTIATARDAEPEDFERLAGVVAPRPIDP